MSIDFNENIVIEDVPEYRDNPMGLKMDDDKPRWDLLPWQQLNDVVKVLTFGAKKYQDNNWKHVSNGKSRYLAAAMRHIAAWAGGERLDSESGLPHLSCAICSLLFLMFFDDEKKI